MLCIHLMQIELLKRIHFVADYYLMQVNMRAVGTYEALFIKGRSAITHGMRKLFGELMKCPACNERIQLRKKQSQCSWLPRILNVKNVVLSAIFHWPG